MARFVTLSELESKARRKADMENTNFVTQAELQDYINESLTELYDLLVSAYGEQYFTVFEDLPLAANTSALDLPADFYKNEGVSLKVTGTEFITIYKYNFRNRNRDRLGGSVGFLRSGYSFRYRIVGQEIQFVPNPSLGAATIRLHYTPVAPLLRTVTWATAGVDTATDKITITNHNLADGLPCRLATTDTLPGGLAINTVYYVSVVDANTIQLATSKGGTAIDLTTVGIGTATLSGAFDFINGWEEYVTIDAAMKMLDKEESSATHLERRKVSMAARLITMAADRDTAEPDAVVDVAESQYDDFFGRAF
jgi:hypothetical protein